MECKCNNNDNINYFFGRSFGNYLQAVFELCEYHHHTNVIVIRIIKLENTTIYHFIIVVEGNLT